MLCCLCPLKAFPSPKLFPPQGVSDPKPVPSPSGDGRAGREEEAHTVAKAALDLSQFCQAEPLGPRPLVLQLQ